MSTKKINNKNLNNLIQNTNKVPEQTVRPAIQFIQTNTH